nr:MAG TPA: hypothetical protein [Caudoviricetes sp.]
MDAIYHTNNMDIYHLLYQMNPPNHVSRNRYLKTTYSI